MKIEYTPFVKSYIGIKLTISEAEELKEALMNCHFESITANDFCLGLMNAVLSYKQNLKAIATDPTLSNADRANLELHLPQEKKKGANTP